MHIFMENRYLFVCMGNVDRSVAGETVFKELLEREGFNVGKLNEKKICDFYIGSAGLFVSASNLVNGSVQLTKVMARRVGNIFSSDSHVTRGLVTNYNVPIKKIIQLDVEDGRSLIVPEQANELYEEFRRKLGGYLSERIN
jgi:hypothetical protein